jgi:hypothetical protein
MADQGNFSSSGAMNPAAHAAVVTPADTDLVLGDDEFTRSIYVGSGGDLAVKMAGGEIVIFPSVLSGSLLPFRVSQVRSTGTTASSIIVVW